MSIYAVDYRNIRKNRGNESKTKETQKIPKFFTRKEDLIILYRIGTMEINCSIT